MSNLKIAIYDGAERIIGQQATYRLYRRVCIGRLLKANCVFIHIPKAAGTSIAEATIGRRSGHYTAHELRQAIRPEVYDRMFSFAVTRHPMARLKSAYHYAVAGGGSDGGIRDHAFYKGVEFRSFEAFVNEWLVYENLAELDNVFRPQYPFIYHSRKKLVDYVEKIENISAIEDTLSRRLERPIRIPKKNTSFIPTEGSAHVSLQTSNIIAELYKDDFELLGY